MTLSIPLRPAALPQGGHSLGDLALETVVVRTCPSIHSPMSSKLHAEATMRRTRETRAMRPSVIIVCSQVSSPVILGRPIYHGHAAKGSRLPGAPASPGRMLG